MDNVTSAAMEFLPRPLNVWGLVVLIAFYLLILGTGVWASYKNKTLNGGSIKGIMLAGRSVGPVVGIFTMTATWVGGGYINGTAEFVFTPGYGLAWTQAMWGFTISLVLGGLCFAKPMREAGYVTMLDPFRLRYGRPMAALMYIPAAMSELFWAGSILSALGASLYVILGLTREVSIIISAAIAIGYTVLGGLYSVVFTDVIQISCMFIGLWLGVGFALAHPAVSNIGSTALGEEGWVGVLKPDPFVGHWLDLGMLLIFGGIPWQVYFQRVLSADSPRSAQILSYFGAFGCLIMSIPPIIIGAVAKSTDWNATDYRLYWPVPIEEENYQMILPLVLQFLTPPVVSIIGLGAVSAAVMSSADSSLLSSSSMFAWNVYKPFREMQIFSKKPSDTEVLWIMRVAVVLLGILACVIAIEVNSTYALFVLCADFVYVVSFPQLACAMFMKKANTYGALSGYVISFFLRLTAGEPLLKFIPLFKYWYYDGETEIQCFPIRTFSMLLGLLAIIIVSLITHKWLPKKWDIFNAIHGEDKGDEAQLQYDPDTKQQMNGTPSHYDREKPGSLFPQFYDNIQHISHL